MGDPERPEAARPDLDEVNVATAFSPVPQSHLPSVLQIATRTSKVGNFTHCHRKAGAGRASSPRGTRLGGRPRGGRPWGGVRRELGFSPLLCTRASEGNALSLLRAGARLTTSFIHLPSSPVLEFWSGETETRNEDWWIYWRMHAISGMVKESDDACGN